MRKSNSQRRLNRKQKQEESKNESSTSGWLMSLPKRLVSSVSRSLAVSMESFRKSRDVDEKSPDAAKKAGQNAGQNALKFNNASANSSMTFQAAFITSRDRRQEAFQAFLEGEGRDLARSGENIQAVRELFEAVYDAKYRKNSAT